MKISNKMQHAFTIVELLVVIVIIGILATLSIVSYSGISTKAITVSLMSDLDSGSKMLKLYNVDNGYYPSTIDSNYCPDAPTADNRYCLKASTGNELDYTGSGQTFTLTATNTGTGISYQITEGGTIIAINDGSGGGGGGGSSAKTFAITWGGPDGFDQIMSIVNNSDGTYVVAGSDGSMGVGDDIFLSKYSSEGALLWNKTWGGAMHEKPSSLIKTNDNGYLLVGETVSFGVGYGDIVMIKYDSDGNVEWDNTWGGTKAGNGGEFNASVVQSNDGNYVIVGATESFGVGGREGFILKISSTDGSTIWNKTWGGAAEDRYQSIIQLTNNDYIVTGYTYSFGSGNSDIVISKYSPDGDLVWNKVWGGTGRESAHKIIGLTGDNFMISGCEDVLNSGQIDAYIAKYNSDGTLLWNKSWGESGDDYAESIIQTSDGGFNITGGQDSFGVGRWDGFIARFDSSGDYKWAKSFGGDGDDYALDITSVSDDGYIMVGYTDSFGTGNTDAFMVRYKSDGSVNYCPSTKCKNISTTVSSVSGGDNNPTVTVYTPSASNSNPTPTITNRTGTITIVVPIDPWPAPTISFSSQELYIAYPGDDMSQCKQWTVPDGKQIHGFYVNHATESGYDYFTVSLDGTEKYNKSGLASAEYVDVSSTPGTVLNACVTADSSTQDGFGGEVTGVYYK